MKKIKITIKNFYTKNIIRTYEKETDLNTYKELLNNLNIYLQEVIIYNEKKKKLISENNVIENEDQIVLFNTDGQIN